jgi:hypothetical protein
MAMAETNWIDDFKTSIILFNLWGRLLNSLEQVLVNPIGTFRNATHTNGLPMSIMERGGGWHSAF